MPRPNLFIIGAAKCGTTSLHHALSSHPDIFMSKLKEPAFFVPELRYHSKELGWYLSLFEHAGSARFIGESSTHYTKTPLFKGVPPRVKEFAPDARLIYLMRDPIDRAISHYWHNTRSVRPEFKETRSMLKAIKEDELYRSYGEYSMQLKPWLDLFGHESLCPLVYEDMVRDPEATLERVFDWLGLASPAQLTLEQRNARPEKITRPKGKGRLERFRRTRLWGSVAPMVPQGLKNWARTQAVEITQTEFVDESPDVEIFLRPWARDQVAAVSALLGRRFPEWRTSGG